MIEIALYCPQIPPNTGNIGRLCVGFGIRLNLIEPLGFSLSARELKRAGLDYWKFLSWRVFSNFDSFYEATVIREKRRLVAFSKRAGVELYDFEFSLGKAGVCGGDILLFGSEQTGLSRVDRRYLEEASVSFLKIPIMGSIRSYNLANSAAMGLSESYRQLRWKREVARGD